MLTLCDLNFSYQSYEDSSESLLKDLNHTFPTTGLCHLKAPNGFGKTTLLKILSGLIYPQKGKITFNKAPLISKHISLMPSNYDSFFWHLTGMENLELFSSLNGKKWRHSMYHQKFMSIENYQRSLKTKFSHCSTGMKQILNYARVFSKEANILLLDEPFQGLDKKTKYFLSSHLDELKGTKLIIIATHEDLSLSWDHEYTMSHSNV